MTAYSRGNLASMVSLAFMSQRDDKHPEAPQVLVVEDDFFVRQAAVAYLEDRGFSVLDAGNADDAITLLRGDWRICAVFTDIQMPGSMDGLALAQWIAEERPDVKVLLTSGHVAATKLQGQQVVTKPYALDEVERQLRGLVHCS
jgi:CheY-like chemotaxis protein